MEKLTAKEELCTISSRLLTAACALAEGDLLDWEISHTAKKLRGYAARLDFVAHDLSVDNSRKTRDDVATSGDKHA